MPNNTQTLTCLSLLSGLLVSPLTIAEPSKLRQQGEEGFSQPAPMGILDQSAMDASAQPSLIQRLNARYKSDVQNCAGGTSALECSGIILRRSNFNTGFDFWTHSPAARELQSVTFSWLRADGNNHGGGLSSGFIFMDNISARAAGYTAQTPRCIYPFMAGTQNAGRTLKGCGPTETDKTPCQAQDRSTASAWSQHFVSNGSVRSKQCALSTELPEQLTISLQVRKNHDALAQTYSNELLIPTWDDTRPRELPIEAFFYNAANSDAFESALQLRNAFYKATSRLVPIVRLDFAASNNQVIKDLTNAQQGRATASALTLRYTNTGSDCGNKASLYCNGVIVRTTNYAETFHAWNPSNKSVESGGVSFSYLREDTGIKVLAWNTLYQGLIFRELDSVSEPSMYNITPLCMYPTDAASWHRGSQGCGAHKNFNPASRQCADQGIETMVQFKTHFDIEPGDNGSFNRRNEHQCSLGTGIAELKLSVDSRKEVLNPQQRLHHNELMIATWPQNIPELLPLEAFFYQSDDTTPAALNEARGMQRDLMTTKQLWRPVIRVDLNAAPENVFTYRSQDQGS